MSDSRPTRVVARPGIHSSRHCWNFDWAFKFVALFYETGAAGDKTDSQKGARLDKGNPF